MQNENFIKKNEFDTLNLNIQCVPIYPSYEDIQRANKKRILKTKIMKTIRYFDYVLGNLDCLNECYKDLYNKTEYWEEKSTLDFNKKDWDKIRKINGRLIRYYNELEDIKIRLVDKENKL